LGVGVALTAALPACMAHARGELVYDYPVVTVETAPARIETYPRTSFRGRPAYFVDGRWYYRSGPRWVYFREEPNELRDYRVRHFRGSPRYGERYSDVIAARRAERRRDERRAERFREERRAADRAERRHAEDRRRVEQRRAAERRLEQRRAAERRLEDRRATERRATERRAAEHRAAERRLEDRRAEQRRDERRGRVANDGRPRDDRRRGRHRDHDRDHDRDRDDRRSD
jgi:hypothetical protein